MYWFFFFELYRQVTRSIVGTGIWHDYFQRKKDGRNKMDMWGGNNKRPFREIFGVEANSRGHIWNCMDLYMKTWWLKSGRSMIIVGARRIMTNIYAKKHITDFGKKGYFEKVCLKYVNKYIFEGEKWKCKCWTPKKCHAFIFEEEPMHQKINKL